jgi:hypothetical protein
MGPSPPPTTLHNLHSQAINTFYSKRIKTKREAGKILNVDSVPLNFIYNWKIRDKHCCALVNAGKTVDFSSEK